MLINFDQEYQIKVVVVDLIYCDQFNTDLTSHTIKQKAVIDLFSSPGPKVQVNYCHHLASVVCKIFTFQASSPKPLGRLEPNLAGMFLGWSSTKLLVFRSSRIFNMAARANNML